MPNPLEKGGEAALRSQKVSAAHLQVYLKGVDYPVNQKQLIDAATKNGAPDNVMMWLNKLPERQYNVPTDVEVEFGKMK